MSDNHQSNGRRLNKSSPLFLLINVIQKSIFPMIVGIYTYGKYANGMQTSLIVIGSLLSLLSILQYWFYHYWIQEDTIEIKEGVLFKNHRKVPYSRIQNVNVLQNPLHRILKVATLQLESASGGKPEAVMRVVSLNVVEVIKQRVRQNTSSTNLENTITSDSEQPDQTDIHKNSLLHLSTFEVIKFGIISQKGLFYVAILAGFISQYESLFDGWIVYLSYIYDIPDLSKLTMLEGLVYISAIAFIAFIILQLLSILWALLKFHDFNIEINEERLQANMGLLSKVSATIPLKRIQLFRISENPLHKFFKAKTITVETAGGVNTDQQGIIMRWLTPYINNNNIKSFINKIEPKIKIGSIQWHTIPERAWRRVFKKSVFMIALLSIPFIATQNIFGLLLFLLLPIAYLYSKRFVKKTAYYIDNNHISFKSGIWFSKQSHVKLNKIQTIEISENPFDRRNQMATLEIDTAGSNPFLHHIKIPYLEKQKAYEMKQWLQQQLLSQDLNW